MLVAVGRLLRNLWDIDGEQFGVLVVDRRRYERDEQRVRPGGPALQLGVRLGAYDERMHVRRVFDELDQMPVGGRTRNPQAAFGDPVTVGVVDLVAVPMPL